MQWWTWCLSLSWSQSQRSHRRAIYLFCSAQFGWSQLWTLGRVERSWIRSNAWIASFLGCKLRARCWCVRIRLKFGLMGRLIRGAWNGGRDMRAQRWFRGSGAAKGAFLHCFNCYMTCSRLHCRLLKTCDVCYSHGWMVRRGPYADCVQPPFGNSRSSSCIRCVSVVTRACLKCKDTCLAFGDVRCVFCNFSQSQRRYT